MARILDLAPPTAAYTGRLFAEVGHQVIRVESPAGDALRRQGPFLDGAPVLESGADHQFFNAGKQSLTLDLAQPGSTAILMDLARTADAIVLDHSLPIAAEELVEANPALVLVTIRDEEPELITVARTGLLSITGQPGETPAVPGAHVSYAIVALHAAIGLSAALLAREASGEGQIISISTTECLISMLEQAMVTYTSTGKSTERRGYRGAVTAVSGAFPCADGYWMLSVPPTADGWDRFVDWAADPELRDNPDLSSESHRSEMKEFILDRIDQWSLSSSKLDLVNEGQARHIPATPVATPLELVDDPQLVGRGFLRELDHPLFGNIRVPIGAIATVRSGGPARAPLLGEHTNAILEELGYSEERRRRLAETRVV